MNDKILTDMINSHQSCFVSKNHLGDVSDIYIRPKAIEESLQDKLHPSDIHTGSEILKRITENHCLQTSLQNGCKQVNCTSPYKGLCAVPNGTIHTRFMFVNKQPTEYECSLGLSCCDKGGLFISLMLNKFGVPRESVYFTDMIKCNAQLNEQSFNECINTYFKKELEIVKPSVIICNGISVLKTCISIGIINLSSQVSYGNIYDAKLFNEQNVKVIAVYDLDIVLQKTGEEYTKCRNELWTQMLNAFSIKTT